MHFSKVRPWLTYALRYWLVIASILFFGLAIASESAAWAAPISAPSNQTVPRPDLLHYLPLIKLSD